MIFFFSMWRFFWVYMCDVTCHMRQESSLIRTNISFRLNPYPQLVSQVHKNNRPDRPSAKPWSALKKRRRFQKFTRVDGPKNGQYQKWTARNTEGIFFFSFYCKRWQERLKDFLMRRSPGTRAVRRQGQTVSQYRTVGQNDGLTKLSVVTLFHHLSNFFD